MTLPASAAWTHVGARTGFEVTLVDPSGRRPVLVGSTTAVEDGQAWVSGYEIRLDEAGRTRWARVDLRTAAGAHTVLVEADGHGTWRVDGRSAPHLDGCLDVDLESSALTNAFPVRRLGLALGAHAEAPAAYVRVPDLRVERLEQTYARVEERAFDYAAPVFGFACRLRCDASGLAVSYPGIAERSA